MADSIKCPGCGSNSLRIIESHHTYTTDREYDVGSGICGAIIFGPLGLLCGLCGADKKYSHTSVSSYYICNECGKKFNR